MKKTPVSLAALAFALALALVASCSSGSSGSSPGYVGACDRIATRCHSGRSALAKTCHDIGHEGDDAACGPRERDCLAECPEEGGGHDGHDDDGGTEDAGTASSDGGAVDTPDATIDEACALLCACLGATCADVANYPYAESGSCMSACAAFSAADRTCFLAFCQRAGDGGSEVHDCEHATGKLGSQECP
jgi:hypothetical protein